VNLSVASVRHGSTASFVFRMYSLFSPPPPSHRNACNDETLKGWNRLRVTSCIVPASRHTHAKAQLVNARATDREMSSSA